MDIFKIVTDKEIDKICDKIIAGQLTIIPTRCCGKTHLQMRIIARLIERGYKACTIPSLKNKS